VTFTPSAIRENNKKNFGKRVLEKIFEPEKEAAS
jgi:hypothetical protein